MRLVKPEEEKPKVFPINQDWVREVKAFLQTVEQGKLVRAAFCYQDREGLQVYKVLSFDSVTGILGMLAHLQHYLLHEEGGLEEWEQEEGE